MALAAPEREPRTAGDGSDGSTAASVEDAFDEPSGTRYTRETAVQISKTIKLPAPFDFELDTDEF
ncbi:hypothetical protein [Streptomyces sp. MST-110588]|uniref:hypothetical protein n=1 Tax=Streptomyces sp. MST-110588 TaxID=2833628 RepID=UPI001F5E13B0|nr:hypothetical protein [Streptomyces sp. MST-110588]UNO40649.1 hypothetical protein KGS77_15035 [Streptomyces sp. MST-110588]